MQFPSSLALLGTLSVYLEREIYHLVRILYLRSLSSVLYDIMINVTRQEYNFSNRTGEEY